MSDSQKTVRPAPLKGVRVLDLTTILAGPYCTYQLALLGAEVIKVERPGQGDWARNGTRVRDIPDFSAQFVAQNADKRSITLDLKTEKGRRIALELLERCDVLVENYSPGVAERLGLGFDAVLKHRPDLVYCSLSGYGHTGPMSARPAYDHVIQAASGVTTLIGTPDTVPNRIGPPMFDYLAGIYGAFAVLSALRERDRTDMPQRVDVAMLDVGMMAMASTVSSLLNAGVVPRPNGNVAASGSPASGIFQTRDGLLSLTANNEAQFRRLCEAVGLQHLLDDDHFASPERRQANAEVFRGKLAEALLERTAADWETVLSEAHLPATRVRTVDQTMMEPHIVQREVQQHVKDRVTGNVLSVPSIGFRWNEASLGPENAPPRLGEHTELLLEELGYTVDDIAALRMESVI